MASEATTAPALLLHLAAAINTYFLSFSISLTADVCSFWCTVHKA
jgi:hypothetical protein